MRFLHDRGLDGLAARFAAFDCSGTALAEEATVLAFFDVLPEAGDSSFKEEEEEKAEVDDADVVEDAPPPCFPRVPLVDRSASLTSR